MFTKNTFRTKEETSNSLNQTLCLLSHLVATVAYASALVFVSLSDPIDLVIGPFVSPGKGTSRTSGESIVCDAPTVCVIQHPALSALPSPTHNFVVFSPTTASKRREFGRCVPASTHSTRGKLLVRSDTALPQLTRSVIVCLKKT